MSGPAALPGPYVAPAPVVTERLRIRVKAPEGTWEADVPADERLTLVELCELIPGYWPAHSCMAGACGTCRLRVDRGRDLLHAEAFGADYTGEKAEGDTVLTCVAGLDLASLRSQRDPTLHLTAVETGPRRE